MFHTSVQPPRIPVWHVVESDIHAVSFTSYEGQIDVVSGGAPCQAFSYAGKRLGFGDTRGTLFAEFARCVKEIKPKMFLFENVNKGLVKNVEHIGKAECGVEKYKRI